MSGHCDPPKHTRFSSTNQPPNESKRKPKLRTVIKELLKENDNLKKMLEAMIDQAKKGNVIAFEKLIDRAYGKVTDKIQQKTDTKIEHTVNFVDDES